MAQNTIVDKVATLNLVLFRDNPFTRVFVLPDDFILPQTVSARLYYGEGGYLLPPSLQPTINLTGHELTLSFLHPERLPEVTFQEILFDNKVKWAGTVRVSYATTLTRTASPSEVGVIIFNDEGLPVEVPSSGDAVTRTFRDQAQVANQSAQEAKDEAVDARDEAVGARNAVLGATRNIVLFASQDDQSITLTWGDDVDFTLTTTSYGPGVIVNF